MGGIKNIIYLSNVSIVLINRFHQNRKMGIYIYDRIVYLFLRQNVSSRIMDSTMYSNSSNSLSGVWVGYIYGVYVLGYARVNILTGFPLRCFRGERWVKFIYNLLVFG